MSETFRCDDKDTLVAYLYGEIDAELRREVERHLRTCAACTRETEGLQAVRQDLQSWVPPEPDLGFTIVQNSGPTPATVLRPSRWAALGALPGWAQVAAALLVMATAAAIANPQVRYGNDGVVVSTGWMSQDISAALKPELTPSRPEAASDESWRPALDALEQNLRTELAQMRRASEPSREVTMDSLMRRMQALVDASERRQREEMAIRLAQTTRDWNLQRQGDLIRIDQNLGSLRGTAFETRANQREVMNILRRVSAAQPIP